MSRNRAAVVVTGHGLLFVVRGVLSETGVRPVKADLTGLLVVLASAASGIG